MIKTQIYLFTKTGNFSFLIKLKNNILLANSGDPDQTPHSVGSDLGLHCLSMSHKKDARFIGWVIVNNTLSLNGEISKKIIFDATHMLSTCIMLNIMVTYCIMI